MKKERVILLSPTETVDSEGMVSQTWSNAATIDGVLLPYGQELALKDYGYNKPVKYRMFYKGRSTALIIGNMAQAKGETLYIVHIADYGKVQDVLLDTELPE